jgi:hypothetical protein
MQTRRTHDSSHKHTRGFHATLTTELSCRQMSRGCCRIAGCRATTSACRPHERPSRQTAASDAATVPHPASAVTSRAWNISHSIHLVNGSSVEPKTQRIQLCAQPLLCTQRTAYSATEHSVQCTQRTAYNVRKSEQGVHRTAHSTHSAQRTTHSVQHTPHGAHRKHIQHPTGAGLASHSLETGQLA